MYLKGEGHGNFHIAFLVSMFSLGMLKPKTAFLKFSECIKVVKYAAKIVQNSAGMCIIMVSSICGITYKNVTSRTRNGVQEVLQLKQVCETRYQLSEWPENAFYRLF